MEQLAVSPSAAEAPSVLPESTPSPKEATPVATEPQKEESLQDLEWSRRFNALSKREKQIVERQRQLENEKKSIAEFNELKKLAQENPSELFSKLGITYDDVTNFYLNDGKISAEQKLKAFEAKINAMEEERLTERQQQEKAKEAQIINEFKHSIRDFVKEGDDYALVRAHEDEGIELVYEVVNQIYENSGKIDLQAAVKLVETHLENNAKRVIESTQKLKKLFQPDQVAVKTDNITNPVIPKSNEIETLTHKATASPISSDSNLSDEENRNRVIAWLQAKM